MENVDWSLIFELAKKHIGQTKKKAAPKKPAVKKSLKKLKGGVQKYKCPYDDYNPKKPLKADFIMHILTTHSDQIKKAHGKPISDAQLEMIAKTAASELKFRSDLAGSEPPLDKAQKIFTKIVNDVAGPPSKGDDEKAGPPAETKEEKAFREAMEAETKAAVEKTKKDKKEADWKSEIAKASKAPAGIPDVMKLMKGQLGEPEAEGDPYVKLAKDTVKKIKIREQRNPADQANKKALSKARKMMKDSKIEPVPSVVGIKVVKKGTRPSRAKAITKPNDGRTVPSKATRGVGLII